MNQKLSNASELWIDDLISMGKLIEVSGCPRPCGDDLASAIYNAFSERLISLNKALTERIRKAEKDLKEATTNDDKAAESARLRAFTEAQSDLRIIVGAVLDHHKDPV